MRWFDTFTLGCFSAPTQTLAMAKFLGMNLSTDTQLMWIAQEALLAKLPEGCVRSHTAASRVKCVQVD